jgi:hypothetical protein
MSTSPLFSSNYNLEKGSKDIEPLLRASGGKWSLIESGKGVERSFKFKTFKKTWVRFLYLVFDGVEFEMAMAYVVVGVYEYRGSGVCTEETSP